MFTWNSLISTVRSADIPAPALRTVTLAQWILESGRGSSALARMHGNFAGLKWRPEMEGYATKVTYGAHDGVDDYCAFTSEAAFIRGYWRFISRSPYNGWENHASDPIGYIRFLAERGYATSAGYADAVLKLLPEAMQLLANAAEGGSPVEESEPPRPDRSQFGGLLSEGLSITETPEFKSLPTVQHKFNGQRPNSLEGAIVHYDAGRTRPTKGPDNLEWGAINTLEHGEAAGFAYATISRSGVIYLPSNMDWNSWGSHAGPSLCPATGRESVSRFYVGFEINCPGKLYPTADADVFIAWFDANRDANGNVILNSKGQATIASKKPEVYSKADLRHVSSKTGNIAPGTYVPYTLKQYEALIAVMLWLKRKYPKTFRLEYVFGHDEVAPKRKVDPGASLGKPAANGPGSAMTMTQFRSTLLKAWAEQLVA